MSELVAKVLYLAAFGDTEKVREQWDKHVLCKDAAYRKYCEMAGAAIEAIHAVRSA